MKMQVSSNINYKGDFMEQNPIRIAHIMGKWLGGGVEAVVMNYYRHIDRNKIQFDFICDDDSTNIPYDEIEALGGKVILIPPYQKVFQYQKWLKKVLREGNYQIVHSHINALSIFPLRAAKRTRVPIRIAHSHSTTNKVEWKKNLLKNALKPFSKVYATHYFACTEHAGRWLFGDETFDKGEVFILNNAIDTSKFKYNPEIRVQKREELGISDDNLVIGHIGRFVQQKNHNFLIDIFNEVYKQQNNSILLLAGQGPLKGEVEDKVNNLGLKNVVKFLGQRDDVNELYQVFDAFLLPSLYEGLGVVLIEAQCACLPCICSDLVPNDVKVTRNVNFLSLDTGPKLWYQTLVRNSVIDRLSETTKCIDSITRSGYDIKKEVKELERLYIDLLV